jgi:alkanesulfonate monooxygenase SsuD/methylene tetrahydromethanopterin reductase-like flavin-dependent oxidoreductase (luciferase family)
MAGHRSTMAYFAGVTETLGFISTVLILPLHPVVHLAKAMATFDRLTEGRVEFGLGVSLYAEEYRLLGVPLSKRGKVADE